MGRGGGGRQSVFYHLPSSNPLKFSADVVDVGAEGLRDEPGAVDRDEWNPLPVVGDQDSEPIVKSTNGSLSD